MIEHKKPIPIRDLLKQIIDDQNLTQVDSDTYVETFTKNLILDSEKLKEIPLDQLPRLNLPLFLEVCISKYILENANRPLSGNFTGAVDRGNFSSELMCPYSDLIARRDNSNYRSSSDLSSSQSIDHHQIHNYNMYSNSAMLDNTGSMVLKYSQGVREEILNSWIKLTDAKSKDMTRFFDTFYSHFLSMDPLNRRLFQKFPMKRRAQNLMKILKFVISSITDPIKYVIPLRDIAVVHLIYGVGERQFTTFSVSLVKTLEEILGDSITLEIKEAWFTIAQKLGERMMSQYDDIRAGTNGKLSIPHKHSWKLVPVKLTHEILYVYSSDAEPQRVTQKISLPEVDEVTITGESEPDSESSRFLFTIVSRSKSYEFCCGSKEDLDMWTKDLLCRVNTYKELNNINEANSPTDDNTVSSYRDGLSKQMSRLRRLVLGSRRY